MEKAMSYEEDETEHKALPSSHIPVLANELLQLLQDTSLNTVLDGTLGAGGHANLILSHHPEIAQYVGIDQDETALKISQKALALFLDKVSFHHTNFSSPPSLPLLFDAILIDIGVSSMQLDQAERGFSFMHEGPLDMRMNQDDDSLMTAEEIVNSLPQDELAHIFYTYGEEYLSRPIAKMICEKRKKKRFLSTRDLASAIEELIPRRGKTHPATKVFQALRVAVNRELDVLHKALEELPLRLSPHGGRFFVITFHSLEDRIVKHAFQKYAKEGIGDARFSLLTKKPLQATYEEIRSNRRSRSAKLRAIERIQ